MQLLKHYNTGNIARRLAPIQLVYGRTGSAIRTFVQGCRSGSKVRYAQRNVVAFVLPPLAVLGCIGVVAVEFGKVIAG